MLAELSIDEPPRRAAGLSGQEQVFADYQTAGLSLKGHPVSFYRAAMNQLNIVPAAQFGQRATTASSCAWRGWCWCRQRPGTAKGITFVTLEDETGVANLIVRMDVWEKYHQVARTAAALVAHGRLQKQDGVIHVLTSRLENLAGRLNDMRSSSAIFTNTVIDECTPRAIAKKRPT